MDALAHSGIFWVGLIAGLVLLYFLPTMTGIIRKVESLGLLIFPRGTAHLTPCARHWPGSSPTAKPTWAASRSPTPRLDRYRSTTRPEALPAG